MNEEFIKSQHCPNGCRKLVYGTNSPVMMNFYSGVPYTIKDQVAVVMFFVCPICQTTKVKWIL